MGLIEQLQFKSETIMEPAENFTSPVSVAPMMDWTDRHCRYFMRLLSPSVFLYTEMITAAALRHGHPERLLQFDGSEHPVALQLGGSNPQEMAAAARQGEAAGYDEININIGCPSDRVQSGRFGACLMAEPALVAECVSAMRAATTLPVTVKTRIGIDNHDDYAFLHRFLTTMADAGVEKVIVHARKAILSGLSPKQNRSVPPLNYERVYRVKQDFPALTVILNGGVQTVADCKVHLKNVDGVMIGRQAYHVPWFLVALEQAFGLPMQLPSRHDIVDQMLPYVKHELSVGTPLNAIARHMLNLYSGCPGARRWRRSLSETMHADGASADVLEMAREQVIAAQSAA